ncbi:MAG: phosphotransferase enzyme family protein [Sporichthyaceae bacterium]
MTSVVEEMSSAAATRVADVSQDGPEPKHPFPLDELMAAWPLGGWDSVLWLKAGKNDHAALTTGHGAFFIRRSYRSKTLAALRFQVELLAALRAHGFPAPVPVPGVDGDPIQVIDGRLYMVTVALPGTSFNSTEASAAPDAGEREVLRTMGRELARFHAGVESFGVTDPEPGTRDLLDGIREKLEAMDVSAAPDLQVRGQAIVARLEALEAQLPQTIMHGGFRRGSLLFTGSVVTGFLDVDSARFGPRALDIATALHDIGKVYTEKGRDDHKVTLDFEKMAAFVEGYTETGEITALEAEAIGVMIEAKRVKRALGRCQRLAAGEVLSENDHVKIDMERARLAWLDANLPTLHAICAS